MKGCDPSCVIGLPAVLVADGGEWLGVADDQVRKGRGIDFYDDGGPLRDIFDWAPAGILALIIVTEEQRLIHPDHAWRRTRAQQLGDRAICRAGVAIAFDAAAAGRLVKPVGRKDFDAQRDVVFVKLVHQAGQHVVRHGADLPFAQKRTC
jgi:hypothetical protein